MDAKITIVGIKDKKIMCVTGLEIVGNQNCEQQNYNQIITTTPNCSNVWLQLDRFTDLCLKNYTIFVVLFRHTNAMHECCKHGDVYNEQTIVYILQCAHGIVILYNDL